jgi:hypothetical protein
MNVIDGGHLLHAVKRNVNCPYVDVARQYEEHLRLNYDINVVLMFDSYGNGPSVKDHEYRRRASKQSPDIVFDWNTTVYSNQ